MTFHGRLEVTDLTTTIDLLGNNNGAFSLMEWEPVDPDVKGSGVWMDNPLLDGRQLAIRTVANVIDNFVLNVKGQTPDDIFNAVSNLKRLLLNATRYWTNPDQYQTPVYLLIQYPHELTPTYALIYDFRVGKLSSPYHQPLYNMQNVTIPELTLTIERGYRGPITGLCANISYEYQYKKIQTAYFYPGDDFDMLEVCREIEGSQGGSAEPFFIGTIASGGDRRNFEIGVRFLNVTIPSSAMIVNARIRFNAVLTHTDVPPAFWVDGEKNVIPTAFIGGLGQYADYIARTRTNTRIQFFPSDVDQTWTIGNDYDVARDGRIQDVIQEIIDLPGWASGNNMLLFVGSTKVSVDRFRDVGTTGTTGSVDYDPPVLIIDYVVEEKTNDVLDPNCFGIIIGNEEKFNTIRTMYRYDDSGGTYTSVTGSTNFNMFPTPPAADDALYFACNFNNVDPSIQTFYSLCLNISMPGSQIMVVWEAYISGSWQAVADCVDETQGLLVGGSLMPSGNYSPLVIHWTPDTNWQAVVVNGVNAYWLRVRITAVGATPVTPVIKGDSTPYVAGDPYIDLPAPSSQSTSSKLRLVFDPVGAGASIDAYSIDEIYVAKRAISRGSSFTPFLNLSPYLHATPLGIDFQSIAGTNVVLNSAPVRYGYKYNPAGPAVETDLFQFGIGSQISSEYAGKFKCLLRRVAVSDPDVMSYRLKVSTASNGITSNFYQTGLIQDASSNLEYTIIDFGVIDLSTLIAKKFEHIFLTVSGKADAACEVYFTDLILLPVDEMLIHVYQRIGSDVGSWTIGYAGFTPVIDNIAGEILSSYIEHNSQIAAKFLNEGSMGIELDSGDVDARLWFFFGTYEVSFTNFIRSCSPGIVARVTVEIQNLIL